MDRTVHVDTPLLIAIIAAVVVLLVLAFALIQRSRRRGGLKVTSAAQGTPTDEGDSR